MRLSDLLPVTLLKAAKELFSYIKAFDKSWVDILSSAGLLAATKFRKCL